MRWGTPSCSPSSRGRRRSEEHTSELQSQSNLVCRLLLEKKKNAVMTRSEQKRDELELRRHDPSRSVAQHRKARDAGRAEKIQTHRPPGQQPDRLRTADTP